MSRQLCITSVDGHTDIQQNKTIGSITGPSLYPDADSSKELNKLGAKIVPHDPGRLKDMVLTLQGVGDDAIYNITVELIEATRKANIPNVCFVSSAGCDLADREKQPRLREFTDLEAMFMSSKGDPSTSTGHSPVVVRAGFYAENLLVYSRQTQEEGTLPLPVGVDHKFAPIALGDVAQVVTHVSSGEEKHGFSHRHRGQLMVLTGPLLSTGDELATAASNALGVDLKFEDIPEYAKKVLQAQTDSSEIQYLLEYYSLVREGKTNDISTTAFHDVTGGHPQEPPNFFKTYSESFHQTRDHEKRKLSK
ncbi:hypothetical protein ASPACDRAFT_54688 [Aspergillus aculeatus ATCC 16872]|uniref:NmrA-like domain-containing protein n=1 Tax=Aspergillus aculeatus (strain ATCC 16872 / CBS 172.66 / WB 5094) TaxID=690307 RepID=A0A1L9WJK9_ASPA1|nr:uncharacterized protein ASPACDRAFT_54688 [Aspergillus aculeatus ATCC 16872]OJJ96344.1 hypothetical protein ASPACDRAFT_54688 [Aspergillus aculeatus ATCC 16872]